ncbi:MAG: dethiobiotin synthase [Verrucomicrobiota bacterium]
MQFFLTATDTEVGKTHVAAGLVRAWRRAGTEAAAVKPMSAGSREDAEALLAAMDWGRDRMDAINPVHLSAPAAPLVAARMENRTAPDLAAATACVRRFLREHDPLIVEGIGGWLVPIAPDVAVREWAQELNLPVALVARGGLGTLNHTLLTVESIRAAGLRVLGVFVNHGAPEPSGATDPEVRTRNAALLRELTGLPATELFRQEQALVEVPLWLGGEER